MLGYSEGEIIINVRIKSQMCGSIRTRKCWQTRQATSLALSWETSLAGIPYRISATMSLNIEYWEELDLDICCLNSKSKVKHIEMDLKLCYGSTNECSFISHAHIPAFQ